MWGKHSRAERGEQDRHRFAVDGQPPLGGDPVALHFAGFAKQRSSASTNSAVRVNGRSYDSP